MLNSVDILRARLGIRPADLDLDDAVVLADDITAFGGYLRDCAIRVRPTLERWGDYTAPTAGLLDAEILLIRREVILDYGFVQMLMPDEYQVGDHRYRSGRMKTDERIRLAEELLQRAMRVAVPEDGGVTDYRGIEAFR